MMTQICNSVSALNELPHGTVLMQPGWRCPTVIVKVGQRWRYVGLLGPITAPQIVADAHPTGWTLLAATDQDSVDTARALINTVMRRRKYKPSTPRVRQGQDMEKKRTRDRERYHRIKKERERQLQLLPELKEESA